jgi:hypothetical protein
LTIGHGRAITVAGTLWRCAVEALQGVDDVVVLAVDHVLVADRRVGTAH